MEQQEVKCPYRYVSENAKTVGKEIEKKLNGLSIKEAQETLEAVRDAISLNNKVLSV
jgi:hypothetical protein